MILFKSIGVGLLTLVVSCLVAFSIVGIRARAQHPHELVGVAIGVRSPILWSVVVLTLVAASWEYWRLASRR